MKQLILILLAIVTVSCAHAAIVVVDFIPPPNNGSEGIKNYTLTARTIGTNQIDGWLAAPLLGATNCEFDTGNAPSRCLLGMYCNGTNGGVGQYGDWILFDATVSNTVPTTNVFMLLPVGPKPLGWHFKQ